MSIENLQPEEEITETAGNNGVPKPGLKEHLVIGIGASAGGLDAINELFDNMPESSGFSFILIQHLSSDHKSMMVELLMKHTRMRVYEATEKMVIEPECIYLIPARNTMSVVDGKLRLHEKNKTVHPNMAIDIFFESLAKEMGNKSVGIILSGTGTDGTKGAEMIKKAGGTVIVQDPLSAEFDGMPNNAIEAGVADMVLSPDMMGAELIEYMKETPLIKSFNSLNKQEELMIGDILEIVYRVTQHDFSHYKKPTITRRLAKRMAEKGIGSLSDYYNLLVNTPAEVKRLASDFLINVTSFFRDKEAFHIIEKKVIPELFKQKQSGDSIKIWVVASSTGEEAYSLAMLFNEYKEKNKRADVDVKIFSTDINAESIEFASRGLYSANAIEALDEDRVSRYFIAEGAGFRVTPSLRRMIVFAKHDVTKDPPYSKIDFLSCRNMLIYLNAQLQKNILLKFHFALNENGYLFLGPSENIGVLQPAMKEIERKWKLYQCITKNRIGNTDNLINPIGRSNYFTGIPATRSKNALHNMQEIFNETLFEEHAYAGILIDPEGDVKQAIGNFKKYIRLPDNQLNFNLIKLVPSDLAVALGSLIRKALKERTRVSQSRIKLSEKGVDRYINIIVKPYIEQKDYVQPFLFVILDESETWSHQLKSLPLAVPGKELPEGYIQELENELRDTKENLQAIIEEVETANEELQAGNEEIISSNEELQSTNEELQSLNEELHTVNAEHQMKIKELVELNEDLNNYFNNSDVGQLLLDRKLTIKRFSPIITRQINLIESDIGRSIADISTNFSNVDFVNAIKKVMQTGEQIVQEVQIDPDQFYLMRISPYLRFDNSIDGVVISFANITETKRLGEILEAVFNSSTSGINAKKAIRNEDGKIVDFEYLTSNNASANIMNITPGHLKGKRMKETFPEMEKNYFDRYVHVVETGITDQFEFFNNVSGRWFEIVCVKLMDGIVTTFTDITDKKEAAVKLQKGYENLQQASYKLEVTNVQLEKSNFDLMQFASVASHDLKEPLRKIQVFGNLLRERAKDKLQTKENGYLDKVVAAAGRMQSLVDDILTLSKLSNNDLQTSTVSLNDILENITDDLEIAIKEKDAQVDIGELPLLNAVPGQMHQLFLNLVSNALKFNESEQPVISVRASKVDESLAAHFSIKKPENYVAIKVQDNGIGFEEAYAGKIFGIFQRLAGSQYAGTGIGLAICKKIVDNHHGFIKADSKPGVGTCFTIVLLEKEVG